MYNVLYCVCVCVCVNLELGCAGVKVALLNGNKIMPKTRSNLDQGFDLEALLANVAVKKK